MAESISLSAVTHLVVSQHLKLTIGDDGYVLWSQVSRPRRFESEDDLVYWLKATPEEQLRLDNVAEASCELSRRRQELANMQARISELETRLGSDPHIPIGPPRAQYAVVDPR